MKQLHCRNFTTLIYVSFVVFGYNSYYVLKDFIIETQVVLFLFFLFFKLKKNPHNYVHATSRSMIKYLELLNWTKTERINLTGYLTLAAKRRRISIL